jgi:signal transduction histidine kinase
VLDPVDRRNAPMLQIVLLLFATLPMLAWGYRGLLMDVPWRPGEQVSMYLSVSLSIVALSGLVLIRRGRFQWAARQTLVVFAVSLCISYWTGGFTSQRFEQPVLAVYMAIAALVVGRSALWAMFLSICLAFALGIASEMPASSGLDLDFIGDGVISAAIFLIIALVLDRTSASLRSSLLEATHRAEDLELARAQLQQEVEQRRLVEDRLVHAQKVQAVARLASGLNHDFNHLLTLVLGYAHQGQRASDMDAMQVAFAGVESAARRANAVSQKLLIFSRQGERVIQRIELSRLIEELHPLLRQTLQPGVNLRLDLTPGLFVDADIAEVELVLLNLVSNANDATADGDLVELTVTKGEDGTVLVVCRDTGVGLSEQAREHLFESFFTTKAEGEGSGLGLALIYDVMERQGGSVGAESAPGLGATFRLAFKASDDARS